MTNHKSPVKLAIVGIGNMGRAHAKDVASLAETELVAVCDIDEARMAPTVEAFGVPAFTEYEKMLDSVEIDGVIIATPHYDHPPMAIAAFKRGLHVLLEKPVAVHVKAGNEMLAAYAEAKKSKPALVFGAVFMQRTYGYYRKIKELIDSGELGKLIRASWFITDWFRTQVYYDSGGWRATWSGEGGGVLLNQSPHNIDLYQWLFGMPAKVTGFASLGKYHHIEVEDEVTAYFEYENGMIGHFVTSTAETPGTNRLEIAAENGKLIFEDGKITFYRNRQSTTTLIKEATGGFDKGEQWKIDIPFTHHGRPGHREMIENFANAVLHGEMLIAPAAEGLNSVMLANAILLSSFKRETVDLPLEGDEYEAKLKELIENSQFTKNEERKVEVDMDQSF